eukprot:c12881_g1_i1.p1 GENE.c12881_g1_i1~~c12881_g1_i1.p1  ORF type:complete len:180 (-),score=31.97 c12881_g1_i1:443-982(-)
MSVKVIGLSLIIVSYLIPELHFAALLCSKTLFHLSWFLLDQDIDSTDSNGYTALNYAISSKCRISFIDLLLEDYGADVNCCDTPPLHQVVLDSNAEVFFSLLEHGADVSQTNQNRTNAAMIAAAQCENELLKALIDHGINLAAVDNSDSSAISYAMRFGHTNCIETLIDSSSSTTLQST